MQWHPRMERTFFSAAHPSNSTRGHQFLQADAMPTKRQHSSAPNPVRVPRSEAARATAAAAVIQKAIRGHLVRKNVRIVSILASEVTEFERRVRADVELLLTDSKERLRVGEMLMALLFRLDSVRGVREYRRKVVLKVISLHDFLDSISGQTLESPNNTGLNSDILPETRDLAGSETIQEDRSERGKAPDAQVVLASERFDPALPFVEGRKQVTHPSDERSTNQDCTGAQKKNDAEAGNEDFFVVYKEAPEKSGFEGFVIVSEDEVSDFTLTEASFMAKHKNTVANRVVSNTMKQESNEPTAILAEESPFISMTMLEPGTGEAILHIAEGTRQGIQNQNQEKIQQLAWLKRWRS